MEGVALFWGTDIMSASHFRKGDVRMKRFLLPVFAVFVTVSLFGCLSPRGATLEEKRAEIQSMYNDTLTQLYRHRPAAEEIIRKAAGHAVFSNVNAQYFVLGGGGGYGIAVNSSSGENTYMKMAQIDLGLGLGVQDIRVIFVFHSPRALNNFVHHGWEFGAQADAAAKARGKGAAATGEISIDAETSMYTLSESGLMAKVNLAGTKYWADKNLN